MGLIERVQRMAEGVNKELKELRGLVEQLLPFGEDEELLTDVLAKIIAELQVAMTEAAQVKSGELGAAHEELTAAGIGAVGAVTKPAPRKARR